MKLFLCFAAFICFALLCHYADAADKPKKPVVCASYRIVESGMALCSDGKKPFVMTRFSEVSAPGHESGTVKVLVGWR